MREVISRGRAARRGSRGGFGRLLEAFRPRFRPRLDVFKPSGEAACHELARELMAEGIRAKVDDRRQYTAGWKFNWRGGDVSRASF